MKKMKKTILLLALAIAAGASCSEAIAKDKKKKNEAVAAPVKEIVSLQTKADSLSYTAGQAYTQGMIEYVVGQLNVDTTYMADFVAGLQAGLNIEDTPQAKAKAAGEQIASMVRDRMLPNIKEQLKEFGLDANEAMFKRGFVDAVEKDASVFSVEEAAKYNREEVVALKAKADEAAKAEGVAWLAENAKKQGVITLPSGLQYKVVKQGTGIVAEQGDDVTVKYEGKLINGEVFDSSYKRNPDTTTFKPTQVIKGWTEALCMMPEGSEWELYIPQELAYGDRPTGSIPAFSTLIFRVEVVSVKKAEAEKTDAEAPEKAQVSKKPAAKKAPAKKPVAKKK